MSNPSLDVLLVEDEPLVLANTADLLTDAGYRVERANSCEQAMAALEAGFHPSVVVTDINLSTDGDGIALAKCVAELWPDIRIILVSGAHRPAREEYPEQALFFTKPYAPGALIAMCAPAEAA
jgi:two-component system, response regulator PdtaR